MEYVTAREAARKWNISVRLVQQFCVDGRIEGARKFSGAWAIPADAQKPSDGRKKVEPAGSAQARPELAPDRPDPAAYLTPMPLMNAAFTPGRCIEYVEEIEDARLRDIARAEYHYFSGHAEEAAREAELYLSHSDLTLRLSACLIYIFANLSLGQIQQAQYTLMEVRNTLASADGRMPPQLRAAAETAKGLVLPVLGAAGLDQAQVTVGGADTREFDPETLESRLCPGIYACGEVLDVDGPCGGYNLQWAWASALLAARAMNERLKA